MVTCKYCGAENAEDYTYCSKCGLPLPNIQSQSVAELRPAGPQEIRRSGFTLASAIIGTGIFFLMASSYFATFTSYYSSKAPSSADSIAQMQLILVGLATALAYAGFASRIRGLALTSAILYSVAAVMYILFTFFLILPLIFGFVGYAKMKPKPVYIVIQQQTQNK